ncbi:hypothetical protein F5884DRAFT_784328 [Xylogone sp. PMI_703]|nr:hypothetical protein F5884DRAFT_784328 [Xylogone sp. PMI_703]
MSLRSPRGYNKMSHEMDIPLTQVRTGGSTGARKQGEGVMNSGDMETQNTFHEKAEHDHHFHHHGGRRKLQRLNSKGRVDSDVEVNAMGRIYNKIVGFSVITRYMLYVAPLAIMIAAPIVVYAIINPDAKIAGVKVYLFFTWIEIVWLSLWISKLIAKALPYVFMFLCGVVSSGTRKYAKVIEALEIPISLVGWAITSLVTFTALTSAKLNNEAQHRWITVMKNVLGPALIATLLYLAEKTLIQLISISYHARSFDQRIKESKHNIYLLGLLFDASRALFPMYCKEFEEEDILINDSIEAMLAKTTRGHKRSGSATPLKLIGDISRVGDKVTSLFGHVAAEITGKQVFNPTSAHSIIVEALEKTKSSEALAKRLWMSFVVEGKEALFIDDIHEVLGYARKEEADEAFAMLDSDGNGDVSLDEMIMKVVDIGRDRKAIANSVRDVGQAIGVLDQVFVTILTVIIVFIFVAFQDTNFVTTLATAGTTLLSLSFVFAVTTQEFLGSCIFLFVKHPYDVGDRVDIVGPEKESLVVDKISLLYTIFRRIDNMKIVQVPNIVLNTVWIENITRSGAMKEQLDMFISFDTSLEDIELLRKEMENFVRSPENSRDFQPDIILEATGIGNMDKLQLKIEIRHKSNWHNETVRAARRSKFMCALVLALRKIPIYAPGGGGEPLGGPTNPSYSVAVPDEYAIAARDKAAKAKEEKRLVPSAPAAPAAVQEHEEDVLQNLNARNPAQDVAHRIEDLDIGRDDNSISSGHTAFDRQRNQDIEEVRSGLVKRMSTSGKRRPGEPMPQALQSPSSNSTNPGITFTSPSPRNDFARLEEEEAEMENVNLGDNGYPGPGYRLPDVGSSSPYSSQRPGPPPPQGPPQGPAGHPR